MRLYSSNCEGGRPSLEQLARRIERIAMTRTHFAEGQVLFREGDLPDSVFRLLSGSVDILRELDGDPILLGTVGAGQFMGEMGVVENRPRSATARAASEVEVEILTPTKFFDQIARSPQAARELIRRLSQRLREADDRIVNDERRSGQAHKPHKDADSHTAVVSVNNAYLSAKSPWLRRQVCLTFRGGNPLARRQRVSSRDGDWSLIHFILRLRHPLMAALCGFARRLVAVRPCGVLVMSEGEGPQPRTFDRRNGDLHDARPIMAAGASYSGV